MKMAIRLEGLYRRGYLGPCAKKTVECHIVTQSGGVFIGKNWCATPQEVCPREPGEDYQKCKTVCRQLGHAEIVALELAQGHTEGARAIITGHTYACQACQEALYSAGIESISVR